MKVCTSCSERIVREIQIIQRLQTEKIARILDIDYFNSNSEEYIVIIEEFISGTDDIADDGTVHTMISFHLCLLF